ncbi:MAG: stage V sporulation protein AE [Limnochordales bacterium]|nr:stage V sporulation protein AE [Limnochordales bacterium]
MTLAWGEAAVSVVWAFLIGGTICLIGQVLIDVFRIPPAHVMVLLVVAGAVLAGLGLYEPFIRVAGAGATVPLSNFGYVLTRGVLDALRREGWFGLLTGVFEIAGGALAAAVVFGFIAALVFRPRG